MLTAETGENKSMEIVDSAEVALTEVEAVDSGRGACTGACWAQSV